MINIDSHNTYFSYLFGLIERIHKCKKKKTKKKKKKNLKKGIKLSLL